MTHPPRASVLIPTHARTRSLVLTVQSVLAQRVQDLEVLIIGDGVTTQARTTIEQLVTSDPRVRFLDRPKGENHGELYRDEAILAARSNAIFYLCDDDLLLRDHIGDLLELLCTHNFVQSLNGCIDPHGAVEFYPGDLADRETVEWVLRDDIRYNSVSLTGTAHTRTFYLECGAQWTTTPSNEWPDHHQWRKMLRHVKLRAATSNRMTALQFPTSAHGRATWTDAERLHELERWAAIVARPDAQKTIDLAVSSASHHHLAKATRQGISAQRDVAQLARQLDVAERQLEAAGRQLDVAERHLEAAGRQADQLDAALQLERELVTTLLNSRSWRFAAPLRHFRRLWPWQSRDF